MDGRLWSGARVFASNARGLHPSGHDPSRAGKGHAGRSARASIPSDNRAKRGTRVRTEVGPYAAIYAVVKRIPRGRVATYGQVASLAGMPGHARQVGYALHHLPDGSRVPWHRVINARGRISFHPSSMEWAVQRALLESEGVAVSMDRGISLARVQWRR